ncbi:MAG: hypothetical protein IPJ41_05405 [Phycisphaerales bacterium]|nr:hypothetical protein [Phycisphaerales bacterium]
MAKRIGSAVLFIILFLAIWGYQTNKQAERSTEVHDEMVAMFQEFPDFQTHGPLYTQWLDAHHEESFERYFHTASRFHGSYFEEEKYVAATLEAMIGDADAAGSTEQAEHLRELARHFNTD